MSGHRSRLQDSARRQWGRKKRARRPVRRAMALRGGKALCYPGYYCTAIHPLARQVVSLCHKRHSISLTRGAASRNLNSHEHHERLFQSESLRRISPGNDRQQLFHRDILEELARKTIDSRFESYHSSSDVLTSGEIPVNFITQPT